MKYKEDERLLAMPAMLTGFARGNFSYRIERTDKNDIIEGIVALFNSTAEELDLSYTHKGYINSRTTYFNRVNLFFLLDHADRITAFNPGAGLLLKRSSEELLQIPFPDLLRPESQNLWKRLGTHSGPPHFIDSYLELLFDHKEKLPLVRACDVLQLTTVPGMPPMKIVVSARIKRNEVDRNGRSYRQDLIRQQQQTSKNTARNLLWSKQRVPITDEDRERIMDIRNYLLNHLDKPMDSLVQLAHTFGTNEYKLKHGFKQLNGETISVFLQRERLRMAAMLLEHSDHQVKTVAKMTGFKNVAHFSRVFKQHLGNGPKAYRQNLMAPGDGHIR